jgi:hypothetical protein
VNPVFWRLHGWVDDRIEEWAKAQEASRPGAIKRREIHGVQWFEIGPPWVLIDEPFVGVSLGHAASHTGHHDEEHQGDHDHPDRHESSEIETMLKVMAAIQADDQADLPLLKALGQPGVRQRVTMRFELP